LEAQFLVVQSLKVQSLVVYWEQGMWSLQESHRCTPPSQPEVLYRLQTAGISRGSPPQRHEPVCSRDTCINSFFDIKSFLLLDQFQPMYSTFIMVYTHIVFFLFHNLPHVHESLKRYGLDEPNLLGTFTRTMYSVPLLTILSSMVNVGFLWFAITVDPHILDGHKIFELKKGSHNMKSSIRAVPDNTQYAL
jgi:hypothetical protein